MILSGWGRYPRIATEPLHVRNRNEARTAVRAHDSLIAYGNGRSYGDSALNRHHVLLTRGCARILDFDPATGRITCEAGLLLSDLLAFAVPRGFFPPVSPGTKFVTIGGMIAADVHGKNHHLAGTFGRHVERLTLLTADGGLHVCTPGTDGVLEATTGGMGLTGVILEATFRLLPIETAFIRQETRRARDFDQALACCEASAGWTYSVAWIDCLARGSRLGRALVYRGEHATRNELGHANLAVARRRTLRLPADLPPWLLNQWSVRAFNELYYRCGRAGSRIVDYDRYFYPLDALLDWNRLYGRAGFMQYQCVLPKPASRAGIRQILRRVADAGSGSFLAVLKLFGPQGAGLLSFPMEGYTLTLDFPVNQDNLRLASTLDEIVAEHGGRLYLAKDARADPAMLRAGYPRLAAFAAIRDRVDPTRRFSSLQSERLGV